MPVNARSLLDPLALVVLGAGAATAALSHTWWIAGLGLVGWGLITVPSLLAKPPPPPPIPEEPLPAAQQAVWSRLEHRVQRIAEAVAAAAPVVRSGVGDLPYQARALLDPCRDLLRKQAQLDQFLGDSPGDESQHELAQLAQAEQAATDPAVRQRYAQARTAAEARRDELVRIRTNRERLAADLAEVEARLKHVHSRIVALDSADQDQLNGIGGELRSTIGDLSQHMAVADRVLDPAPRASVTA